MSDPVPSGDFGAYRDGLLHGWLRILTTLGYSLIPIFFLLDAVIMPSELLARFAIYRASATVLVLGQHLLVRRTAANRWSFLHGYAFSVVVSVTIVQMSIDLGGFNSTYYAGLNLVLVAVNLLLPWRAVHSALNGLVVMGLYVAGNLLLGKSHEVKDIVNNLYFMGGTVVISVALTQVRYRQIEQEFQLRQELLVANVSLDKSRAELKTARDALWGEMEVAQRIQTALLPANRRLGRYEIAAAMRPAAEVGGDYYDFFQTQHGERWLAVGDVSGHGVEAGLVMMMTQTAIATLVGESAGKAPSHVFAEVNRTLLENISRLGAARFMTLNIVRLDDTSLTLAGKHQDLLIWRAKSQRVETLSYDGCWIGVVPDTIGRSVDLNVPLEEADMVFFFTDGLTEATNARREMFGQDRVVAAFAEVAKLPLERALTQLLEEVKTWQSRQDDDITLVLVRVGPSQPAT